METVAQAVIFTAPRQVEVREEVIPKPSPGQVLVRAKYSAISPGTEMLIYQGNAPDDLPLDETISSLKGDFHFPVKYGYAVVGQVVELGDSVDEFWHKKFVFAFHPHQSAFISTPNHLFPIPEGVSLEEGVFIPNIETAVNFLMDGHPIIGEKVAVLGQGIVGLLTTSLLSMFPLESLITFDRIPLRRQISMESGANASFDPEAEDISPYFANYDLVFEISGSPEALELAIKLAGFDGRVIVGSWYGQKNANLNLGGRFHRDRIRLVSSQVSTIAPQFRGRWTNSRRLDFAWKLIPLVQPAQFITHRFPIEDAPNAYQLLVENQGETIQVIFEYP